MVLAFLRDTKVGRMVTLVPSEEEEWEGPERLSYGLKRRKGKQ